MPKTPRDASYSRRHCIQRFRERYGGTITEAEYDVLTSTVGRSLRAGTANVVNADREPRTRTVVTVTVTVTFHGTPVYVLWDVPRALISTLLDPATVKTVTGAVARAGLPLRVP
jgi:hypothetical protein